MTGLNTDLSTQDGPQGSDCPHPILIAAKAVCVDGFGSLDAAGAWLGYSRGVLSAQLKNAERHKFGLLDAYQQSVAVNDPAVPKAWCAQFGLATVQIPTPECIGDVSLMCSFSAFIKEMGDVCEQFNQTMADNRVESHEVDAMRKQAMELINALMLLIMRLEALQE